MTIKELKSKLAEHRMSLRHDDGEYRVNFAEAATLGRDGEATAYYTCNRDDALASGIAMRAARLIG